MRTFTFFLTAVAFLLIQSMIKVVWPAIPAIPEMTLICIMYFGVYREGVGGLLSAYLLGSLAEIIGGAPPGFLAMSYSIVFIVVRLLGRTFYMRSKWFQIILVIIMTLVWRGSGYLLLSWFPGGMDYSSVAFSDILYRLLANILVSPFVFAILFGLEDLMTKDYQSRMYSYRIR